MYPSQQAALQLQTLKPLPGFLTAGHAPAGSGCSFFGACPTTRWIIPQYHSSLQASHVVVYNLTLQILHARGERLGRLGGNISFWRRSDTIGICNDSPGQCHRHDGKEAKASTKPTMAGSSMFVVQSTNGGGNGGKEDPTIEQVSGVMRRIHVENAAPL